MSPSPRRWVRRGAGWIERRARRTGEPHGLVLMYHRVARPAVDPWQMCVTPRNFEAQVSVLRDIADVVPLQELGRQLRVGRRSRPVVSITFDDGYADNLTCAKPILQKHRLPATVFLATGYIDAGGPFWWDLLAESVLAGDTLPERLELELAGERIVWTDPHLALPGRRGTRARRQLHDQLWKLISPLDLQGRSVAVTAILDWAGKPRSETLASMPMTEAEVRQLIADGLVTIGGHTMSHCRLPLLTTRTKKLEIEGSRRDCGRFTGALPDCFAFPHGELDAESLDLVEAAGFSLACTSQEGLLWSSTNPMLVPRVYLGDCPGPVFLRRLRWWLA